LIADDHPLFREAIKQVLAGIGVAVECTETSNYTDLLALIAREGEAYGVIFVDLGMPGGMELTALQMLRDRAPRTPTIVVSGREDAATIRRVLACGVAGYVPKSTPKSELEAAVRRVLGGGVAVPRAVAGEPADDVAAAAPLTPRQAAVLEQLGLGNSNRQIAKLLGIEEITVKAHISAILRKLNVKNRLQAVVSSQHYLEQIKDRELHPL
jgi:DNA-binding NarL/FixJ family response regulator